MFDIKLPPNPETIYKEMYFKESYKWVNGYHASKIKHKGGEIPAVTLTFKNTFRAKCFIYWVQKLCGVNSYEASVYLQDNVEEIYKGLK